MRGDERALEFKPQRLEAVGFRRAVGERIAGVLEVSRTERDLELALAAGAQARALSA